MKTFILLVALLLSFSASAYEVDKVGSTGSVYLDTGDDVPLKASPILGLDDDGNLQPIKVESDGTVVTSGGGGGGGGTTPLDGRTSVALIEYDCQSTPVTDSAYAEILASSTDIINKLDVFNSTGATLYLAVGGSGSEVNKIFIYPSGNDEDLKIPAGSRLSIKAVSGTSASVGVIRINALK